MNGAEHLEKHGVWTERFRFHRLNVRNGVIDREAVVQDEVRRDHTRTSTHTCVTVDQDAFLGCGQDGVNLTGDKANVFLKQWLPFFTVINGNPIRRNIVLERTGNVSSTVDNESDIVVPDKVLILRRVDGPYPDTFEDLSRRKHVGIMTQYHFFPYKCACMICNIFRISSKSTYEGGIHYCRVWIV